MRAALRPLNALASTALASPGSTSCCDNDVVEVTPKGETWEARDRRLRSEAIELTDSPEPSSTSIGDEVQPELRTRMHALDMAYAAGALSRAMYASAVEELRLTFCLADGVILEDNHFVENSGLEVAEAAANEEDDDNRDGWFLVLESNEDPAPC